MPRGVPIQPELRARILELARAGRGRNDIAREVGTSVASVTRVAQAAGIEFDREQTKQATAALKIDLAAERAAVSALLLRRSREALEQMDQPHLAFNFGGKDNTYEEHLLDRPPTGDMKNLMSVATMGMRGHLDREKFDSTGKDAATEGLSMVSELFKGLSAVADAIERQSETPGEDGVELS